MYMRRILFCLTLPFLAKGQAIRSEIPPPLRLSSGSNLSVENVIPYSTSHVMIRFPVQGQQLIAVSHLNEEDLTGWMRLHGRAEWLTREPAALIPVLGAVKKGYYPYLEAHPGWENWIDALRKMEVKDLVNLIHEDLDAEEPNWGFTCDLILYLMENRFYSGTDISSEVLLEAFRVVEKRGEIPRVIPMLALAQKVGLLEAGVKPPYEAAAVERVFHAQEIMIWHLERDLFLKKHPILSRHVIESYGKSIEISETIDWPAAKLHREGNKITTRWKYMKYDPMYRERIATEVEEQLSNRSVQVRSTALRIHYNTLARSERKSFLLERMEKERSLSLRAELLSLMVRHASDRRDAELFQQSVEWCTSFQKAAAENTSAYHSLKRTHERIERVISSKPGWLPPPEALEATE